MKRFSDYLTTDDGPEDIIRYTLQDAREVVERDPWYATELVLEAMGEAEHAVRMNSAVEPGKLKAIIDIIRKEVDLVVGGEGDPFSVQTIQEALSVSEGTAQGGVDLESEEMVEDRQHRIRERHNVGERDETGRLVWSRSEAELGEIKEMVMADTHDDYRELTEQEFDLWAQRGETSQAPRRGRFRLVFPYADHVRKVPRNQQGLQANRRENEHDNSRDEIQLADTELQENGVLVMENVPRQYPTMTPDEQTEAWKAAPWIQRLDRQQGGWTPDGRFRAYDL